MKIFWITNTAFGPLYEFLHGRKNNGVWMETLLNFFINDDKFTICVVTTGRNKESIRLEDKNVTYYSLPGGYPFEYNFKKTKNINAWKTLLKAEKPDLIQIWGTEFSHSLPAILNSPNIPKVVFMQGLIKSINQYYYAGISPFTFLKNTTLRDLVKNDSVIAKKWRFARHSIIEKRILELCGNAIVSNHWCQNELKGIYSQISIFFCPLSINTIFASRKWKYEKTIPHRIIMNVADYPLKGLHNALKAISVIKTFYPDVKLIVPGPELRIMGPKLTNFRINGYEKIIKKIVHKYDLFQNVSFIGNVTPETLRDEMLKSNVFILSSAIENHSSMLQEAMQLGLPCVASFVGGVQDYGVHGQNLLFYRFEETSQLAFNIIRIFEDQDVCKRLSENARQNSIMSSADIKKTMCEIYAEIVEKEKYGNAKN